MRLDQFQRASRLIGDEVHRLAPVRSDGLSQMFGGDILLQCEHQQKSGSFKARGIYAELKTALEKAEKKLPVHVCGSGNLIPASAWAAARLGQPCEIVLPAGGSMSRLIAAQGYGAQVIQGGHPDKAVETARNRQQNTGGILLMPEAGEDRIAGFATVAEDILQTVPDADIILVPCGSGSLLAGIAAYAKQMSKRVRVIGVQAEGADAVARSLAEHRRVTGSNADTLADGLVAQGPGEAAFQLISRYVDDVVCVSDAELCAAVVLLHERCKQVVEPAGAAAVAALLRCSVDAAGKRVVCVLTGGNVEYLSFSRILERGLVQLGRRVQFHTLISDLPGSMQRFCDLVTEAGANMLMMQHDRRSPGLQAGEALLQATCEVGGPAHLKALMTILHDHGYSIVAD